MKPFRWGKVERPESMVDIPRIKVRVSSGNRMRVLPQLPAAEEPCLLAHCHALEFPGRWVLHALGMIAQVVMHL